MVGSPCETPRPLRDYGLQATRFRDYNQATPASEPIMSKKTIEDMDSLLAPIRTTKLPEKVETVEDRLYRLSKGKSWVPLVEDYGARLRVTELKTCSADDFLLWLIDAWPPAKSYTHSISDYATLKAREKTLDTVIALQSIVRQAFSGTGLSRA